MFIFNLIDFMQTIFALTYTNLNEINPFINFFSSYIGLFWTLFILKIVLSNFVLYSFYIYSYKATMSHINYTRFVLIAFILIVLSNFWQLYRNIYI